MFFFKDDGRYLEAEALLEKAVEIRLVFLQCFTQAFFSLIWSHLKL